MQCFLLKLNEVGHMRIGAYQFLVTGDVNSNFNKIKYAIDEAKERQIKLLVFPECALTGYPPRDLKSSADVDFARLDVIYDQLQQSCNLLDINIVVGTITQENNKCYNAALFFSPYRERQSYKKRALWGWDTDNFDIGNDEGIFQVDDWKIGIRICFEIRFPEYFRQLYKEQTDLNIVMFYDVSDYDDVLRYEMIKSHIMTRAVENITYTLSVNAISPFQTAPTILFGRSGQVFNEIVRNEEGLLEYDLEKKKFDFGEAGRKEISDWLLFHSEGLR